MNEPRQPLRDPLDEVIASFQRMDLPARPQDAEVLARIDAERKSKAESVAIPLAPNRPGYVVRLLAPSAAAAVVLILGIGLLLLNDTTSIALADVVKATAKHKLVRYREQQVRGAKTLTSTVYADFTAPRLYSESRIDEPNGAVLLSVHDGRHHLTTNSHEKTATLNFAPKGYKSLLCCLEEFQQKKDVTQEWSDLAGCAAVKYRYVDSKETITLWIEPSTKLPLRLEQTLVDSGSPRRTLIWTDFAFDPDLPPGVTNLNELFSTRPPDGYALDDRTKREKQ